jgi:hypothetical protein
MAIKQQAVIASKAAPVPVEPPPKPKPPVRASRPIAVRQQPPDKYLGKSVDTEPAKPSELSSEPEAEDEPKEPPLCRIAGHNGFWRSDGYWCAECGRLYQE